MKAVLHLFYEGPMLEMRSFPAAAEPVLIDPQSVIFEASGHTQVVISGLPHEGPGLWKARISTGGDKSLKRRS